MENKLVNINLVDGKVSYQKFSETTHIQSLKHYFAPYDRGLATGESFNDPQKLTPENYLKSLALGKLAVIYPSRSELGEKYTGWPSYVYDTQFGNFGNKTINSTINDNNSFRGEGMYYFFGHTFKEIKLSVEMAKDVQNRFFGIDASDFNVGNNYFESQNPNNNYRQYIMLTNDTDNARFASLGMSSENIQAQTSKLFVLGSGWDCNEVNL